jgi:hypothetical protein
MPNPDCASRVPPSEANSCDWDTFLGIDSPYEVKVTDDPEVNALMCQSNGKGGPTTFTTSANWDAAKGPPPPGYPSPGAKDLACSPEGTTYMVTDCKHTGSLCQGEKNCTIWTVELNGAARPPGWPCP